MRHLAMTFAVAACLVNSAFADNPTDAPVALNYANSAAAQPANCPGHASRHSNKKNVSRTPKPKTHRPSQTTGEYPAIVASGK